MENKDNHLLFNYISPIYGHFYKLQTSNYKTIFNNIKNELSWSDYKNLIDIGCGTGALCNVLHEHGLSVTGIDPAKGMIEIARKKAQSKDINFLEANVLNGLPFEDKSFDIAISSFVAHGLNINERQLMYNEMSRIAKHLVVIYDYNEHRGLITDVIEWLEGGDYFNFIKKVKIELLERFGDVKIVKANIRSSLYICEIK